MPKTKAQVKVRMQKRARVPQRSLSSRSNPTFGAVSTINTAPVAIGNSMRGSAPQIMRSANDSVRVIGRDFAQTAYNSGTVTNWLPVAGFPVTPNCFVSSVLRNYCQMYNKFKFNKLRIHYITSSPTSSSGDVLFQVNAGRSDPLPNWTGSNFLPYALSKPETIIGPQWTNHTMEIVPKGPFRNLDLGQNLDIDYQAQGEVFMYSKTSSTDSPGYLLIDYDITFAEMAINPKQGLLPNPLLLLQPCQLTWATTAYTANTTAVQLLSFGTTGSGNTTIPAISSSTAFKPGDIYKYSIDATNTNTGGWTFGSGSATLSTLISETVNGTSTAMTLVDGYTLYLVAQSATNVIPFTNIACAFTASSRLTAGATYTAAAYNDNSHSPNAGVWLMGFISYVGSINPNSLQQQ